MAWMCGNPSLASSVQFTTASSATNLGREHAVPAGKSHLAHWPVTDQPAYNRCAGRSLAFNCYLNSILRRTMMQHFNRSPGPRASPQ